MSANTGWDSLDLPGSQPVNGHIDDPVSNFQHDTDTATDAAYVEHDLDAAVLEPEHAHEGDFSSSSEEPAASKPRRNTKVLAMMGALSLAMLGGMVVVLKPAYDVLFGGGPQVSAAPPPASAALAVAAVRADAGAAPGATSESQGAPGGAGQAAAPVEAAYVAPSPEKPAPAAQDVAHAAAAAAPAATTLPAAVPASATAAATAPATAQPATEAPTSSAVAAVLSNASAPDHNAGAPAQRSRSEANTATPAAVVAEAPTARHAEGGTGTGTKAPTRKAPVARTKPPKATTVTQWAARSTPVARRPSRSAKAQPTAASATRGSREQVLGFTLLAINPHTGDFQQAWVRDTKGKLQVLSAGDRLGGLQVLRIDGAKSEVVTTAGVIR